MDIMINDLNSKFASMSTILEEIRSTIHNQPLKQVWRHDDMMSSDEDEGEETMDEYNRGPMRGERRRTMAEIPNFVGNLDIEAVLDWLYEVDKFFEIMEVPKEEQVKTTRGYLDEDETDDQRYIGGLNSSIQERLSLTPIWSQAQNMAIKAKRMASKTEVGFRRSNMESSSNYGSRPNPIQSTIPSTTTTTLSSKASRSGGDKNKESQLNDGLTIDEAFQEEDELEYAKPLDEEAEQVTYVIQRTLCSPKKGPTLKVTEICKVPLAIGKHYNELVTCDVVDMEACHVLLGRPCGKTIAMLPLGVVSPKKALESKTLVTLVASPKEFQAEKKETGVFYALFMKGVEDFMKNTIPAVVKPLLAEFSKIVADDTLDAFTPLRNIQHQIDLIPKASLPNLPHYRMSPKESEVLREKIEELLKKGHIQESINPCMVLALLTPKDDSWRMCVDSRAINKITKTAFKTKDGLYEWLVMPFGLSNVPSMFMRLMTQVLRPFMGKFVVVYFDDILIYSQTKEEQQKVMKALADNDLFVNLKKCTFLTNKLLFLGYIVSSDGIHVEETKVQAVRDWSSPKTLSEVRSFHGLATFYRRFAEESFKIIKEKLTIAPILSLPNFDKVFELDCDACGTGIGAILSQEGRPVAFHSEKLNEAR
ncbi:transposon ty3-I gag-pol polyprotein [Tanacetum coccineum]